MEASSSSSFDCANRLVEHLLTGDLRAAEFTLRESGFGGPLLLDDVIAPAMYEIGERWSHGTVTTAEEHLASTTAHRLLVDLAPTLVRVPAGSRETVLLASARRERHTLGLTMAADVLRGNGFDVQVIEGGVPHDDLLAFARARKPEIIGLSIGMPSHNDVFELYERIVSQSPDVGILFGGRVANAVVSEIVWGDPLARIANGVSNACELADELIAARREGVTRRSPSSRAPLVPVAD